MTMSFCFSNRVDTLNRVHVVFVGGGRSSLQVLRTVHEQMINKSFLSQSVQFTLINEYPYVVYSEMISGVISHEYSLHEAMFDLKRLIQSVNGQFVCARALKIDWYKKQVICQSTASELNFLYIAQRTANEQQEPAPLPNSDSDSWTGSHRSDSKVIAVPFDIIVLNVGSTCRFLRSVPGALEHAVATRPTIQLPSKIASYESLFLNQIVNGGYIVKHFRIVVVGAGIDGVELLCCLSARFEERFKQYRYLSKFEYTIIDSNEGFEQSLGCNRLGQSIRKNVFEKHDNFKYIFNCTPKQVNKSTIELNDGSIVEYDLLLWSTDFDAPQLLKYSHCALDSNGYLKVNRYLQSVSHPTLFAAGNCIRAERYEHLSKSGADSMRMGSILSKNVLQAIQQMLPDEDDWVKHNNSKRKPLLQSQFRNMVQFKPQSVHLRLMNVGNERAIAECFGWAFGPWKWLFLVKDYMDTRFVKSIPQAKLLPGSRSKLADPLNLL